MTIDDIELRLHRNDHLSPQMRSFALFLASTFGTTGLVDVPQRDLAVSFGVSPSRVSQLITALTIAGIIHPASRPSEIDYKSRAPFWIDEQYLTDK